MLEHIKEVIPLKLFGLNNITADFINMNFYNNLGFINSVSTLNT